MENWEAWYLGGIWDADGTFGLSKRPRGGFQPFAGITICNPKSQIIGEMIERNFGFKCVWSSRRDNPKWNIAYRWILSSQRACEFARVLEPYLIIKKERAQILATWPMIGKSTTFRQKANVQEKQQELYERMKVLNKRGTSWA